MTELLGTAAVSVTTFSFGCMLGGAVALVTAAWLAIKVNKVSVNAFAQFAPASILLAFLCSRLMYIAGDMNMLTSPVRMIRFWEGGYSIIGAIAGFLLAALWTSRKNTGIIKNGLLNSAAVAVLPGAAVLRIFEGISGIGRGREIVTEAFMFLGEKDQLTGIVVHPVYKYEMFFSVILFVAFMVLLLKNRDHASENSDFALMVVTLFAATQIVLEAMKDDRHMVIHFVPVQQVFELIMLLIPLVIWTRRVIHNKQNMKKSRMALIWLLVIVCIGLFVYMEFCVDRGSYKLLYYCVMTLCMTAVAGVGLYCCKKSRQA